MREKLKIRDETSKAYLNRFERQLMQLTQHELGGHAVFQGDGTFWLKSFPNWIHPLISQIHADYGFGLNLRPSAKSADQIPLGVYELPRRTGEAHLYRLNHPLAEAILTQAKNRELVDKQREELIAQIEGKLQQHTELVQLFSIHWRAA